MKNKSIPALAAACGLLCAPALAAVYSHYSFDSDFTDDSGNGKHGTLTDVGTTGNSGIITTAGDFMFGGGAMDFSADRDYLAVPSVTFGTGTAYTVAFWARKAPGDTGDPALWDMVIGRRDDSIFFIGLNDGTGIRWRSNTSAGGTREVDFAAPDDTAWHHFAITADSSKNLTFYLDGSFVDSQSNVETGFIIDTIGEAYSTARDFDFHGQIDEMWIFDEELDSTEVSNLVSFNNTVPEPSVGLLGMLGGVLIWRRRR